MSLFQMMSKTIYDNCSSALRETPMLKVAVLAAAPALMMFMGGMTMDSMHEMEIMKSGGGFFDRVTVDGAQAYQEYLAGMDKKDALASIWHGVTGGYESDGRNVAMAGLAAVPGLSGLAVVGKIGAHIAEFAKEHFGFGKEKDNDKLEMAAAGPAGP